MSAIDPAARRTIENLADRFRGEVDKHERDGLERAEAVARAVEQHPVPYACSVAEANKGRERETVERFAGAPGVLVVFGDEKPEGQR